MLELFSCGEGMDVELVVVGGVDVVDGEVGGGMVGGGNV